MNKFNTETPATVSNTTQPMESSPAVPNEPGPMISQAELRAYVQQAKLSREHQQLREHITARLERGVPVEPGELKAEIEPEEVKRWSSRQLTELLGPEKTNELWHQLQPVRYRRLLVLRAGQDVAWKAYRLTHPPLETIPPPSASDTTSPSASNTTSPSASNTAPPSVPRTAPSSPTSTTVTETHAPSHNIPNHHR